MTQADNAPDGVVQNPPQPTVAPPPLDPLIGNALNSINDPAARNAAITALTTAGLPDEAIPAWVSAIHNESDWNLNERDGTAGEIGPGQIKPETGADMGFTEAQLRDPQKNLTASAKYFAKQWADAKGDDQLALTGYNAGNVRARPGEYADKAIIRMAGWIPPKNTPVFASPDFAPDPPDAATTTLADAAAAPAPIASIQQPPPSTAPAASSTPSAPTTPPRDASQDGANVIAPDAIAPTSPAASSTPTKPAIATSPLGDRPYLRGTVVRPVAGVDRGDFKPTAIVVPGQSQTNADLSALGQGLAGGVASAVRGTGEIAGGALTVADTNAQALARAQLGVMDRIDAGQTVPAMDDPLGYGDMSSEQRQATRQQYAQQLQAMRVPGQTPIGAAGAAATGAANAVAQPLDSLAQSMPVDTSKEGFGTNVARGIGNLAPAVAAGLTPAGIGAVAGIIGTQSFDATYRDAIAHGADQDTAYQTATINGLAQAGLMSVPLSGAIMKVADATLRDGLMKTAINYASHAVTMEGAGEAGRFVDNYIARQTYDPTRDPLEGLGQTVGSNIALGLIVPVVHGAGDIAGQMLKPSIEASPELQNAANGISSELARVQAEQSTSAPVLPPDAAPTVPDATNRPASATPAAPPANEAIPPPPVDSSTTKPTQNIPNPIPETSSAAVKPDIPGDTASATAAGSPAPVATADLPPPIPDIPQAPSLQDRVDALATSVAAWKQSALHPDAALAQSSYPTVGAAAKGLAGLRQMADRQAGAAEINTTLQQLSDAGQPLPFRPTTDYQGDDARRAMQAEPRMPGDLASVISKLGGVRPDTSGADDLRSMDLDKRIGFFNRGSRFSVEDMANHLAQLGYLGDADTNNPHAPDATSPLDTLMYALDLEKSGALRFSNRFNDAAEQSASAVRAYNEAAQYVADKLGLSSLAAKQLTRGQVEDALTHFGGDYALRGDQPALDALRTRLRGAEPDWSALPAAAKDARVRLADVMQTFMGFSGLPPEMGLRLMDKITSGSGAAADGRYNPETKAIDFALDTDWRVAPQKFFHEIMHPMLDLLPGGQKQAIRADANRWLGAARRIDQLPEAEQIRTRDSWRAQGVRGESNRSYLRRVYADQAASFGGWDTPKGQQLLLSEAVSHMAEDTMADLFTPKPAVLRAIGSVGRFMDRIGNALNGEGFQTGQDVIRTILSGDKAVGNAKQRLRSMPPRGLPPAAIAPPASISAPGNEGEKIDDRPPAESPNPTAAAPVATAPIETPPAPTPTTEFGRTTADLLAPRDAFGLGKVGDAGQAARSTDQGGLGGAGVKQPASSPDGSISGAADNGAYHSLRDPERVPGLPGFYSPVARAALDLKQERGSGEQMLAMISKSAGVKPEEMRWLGLDTWLRGQGKVTRDQVLDYIRANSLDVREVVKGAPEDQDAAATQQREALDRLSDLVARDGGSGTPLVPEERQEMERLTRQLGVDEENGGQPTRYQSYALPGGENYRELLIALPEDRPQGDFESDHWDEKNVLAHARFTERVADDGARTLLLEEAQSDWHQAGRKRGYREEARRPPDPQRIEEWGAAHGLPPDEIRAAKTSFVAGKPNDTYQAWAKENAAQTETLARWSDGTAPEAPFKTTWPSLVMKRMIRWAVDNGFDRVAWSPGDVHADRYDLSKQISRVELHKTSTGIGLPKAGPFERGMLDAFDRFGNPVIHEFISSPEHLADHVGKEIAQRLLDAPEQPSRSRGASALTRKLAGLDLRVGGEGMRGFYDKILPAETNKLISKFGGKVEKTTITQDNPDHRIDLSGGPQDGQSNGEPETASAPVHSFNITPAMRQAILNDGMPLFSLREQSDTLYAKVTEARRGWGQEIRRVLAPITTGSRFAQASAARYASFEREIATRFRLWDEQLQKRFNPAERRLMWEAMDDQSLFELELREQVAQVPREEEASFIQQARERFAGQGLDRLSPEQRDVVIQLDAAAKRAWEEMRVRGILDNPEAQGLPFYSPRFFVDAADGTAKRLDTGSGPVVKAIDPLGLNLSTAGPRQRDIKITAEALRAMRANYPTADLVRDIRVLPMMLAREQRAVAAVDLVRAIKRYGEQIGVTLVSHNVPSADAKNFVTIDHPAFKEQRPRMVEQPDGTREQALGANGVAIYDTVPTLIHANFEGPLKAVLRGAPATWYRTLMTLKRLSVGAIMYSPLVHLEVELGRTLPLMKFKLGSVAFWQAGNKMRMDPDYMSDAVMHGLAPIGGSWASNVTDIYNEPNLKPSLFGKVGDAWHAFHQKVLWDRIQQMQVGIYDTMRQKYLADGFEPGMASYMAAHLANRYAGALPQEALSKAANIASNIALFSRSYTLGNLGAIKDMLNGMPSYVRAQMEQGFRPEQVDKAAAVLRRKAQMAFVWDVALFYIGNSLLQDGMRALLGDDTLDRWAKSYVGRFLREKDELARHPWKVFNLFGVFQSLTSSGDNEPGKENRIGLFTDSTGQETYLRNPVGKVGEDFAGWFTNPVPTLRNKLSPMLRGAMEVLMNTGSFGRPVYDEHGSGWQIAGSILQHMVVSQFPADQATAAYNATKGAITGTNANELADTIKVLGPTAGLQFSHGFPGGPVQGAEFAHQQAVEFARRDAYPNARAAFNHGDETEARRILTEQGGMNDAQVNRAIISMGNPVKSQIARDKAFNKSATDPQQERVDVIRHNTAPPAFTAAQRGKAQADSMFQSAGAAAAR